LWKLDACVKARVLVDRVCLMTTLRECERLFSEFPCKSVARASRELDMPKITVWKVLLKLLCFKLYKMRLVQALTPADKVKRRDFCEEMQLKMEENDFVERIVFCDEATSHIIGKVKGQCPYLGNRATTCADRTPA